MVLNNLVIVQPDYEIKNGYLIIEDSKIVCVGEGKYNGTDKVINCDGLIAFPGFIDVHIHGSMGIDFMDANQDDYKIISESLYKEGVTTYLATTLTSDFESLKKVCETVKGAKKDNPSLLGIHFEGPYINAKHKGAQNEAFIRDPDLEEFKNLQSISGNNIKYISLAPEKTGSLEFIEYVSSHGTVVSAGHSDASFEDIEKAINVGLTNITHTHNAMSGYHHRNPGIVTAAMYFDNLYTEVICDKIHVCTNTLKTFLKAVGPNRFMMITDSLKIKHSDLDEFKLFGLPCIKKDGAAYLTSGPLAGSLLSMDQGLRNMKEIANCSLSDLSKITSLNAAKCLNLNDRGSLEAGKLADIVLLDKDLNVCEVYKLGKRVF